MKKSLVHFVTMLAMLVVIPVTMHAQLKPTAPAASTSSNSTYTTPNQTPQSRGYVTGGNFDPGLNPDVPIDNGVVLLIAAAVMLGAFKMFQHNKKQAVA